LLSINIIYLGEIKIPTNPYIDNFTFSTEQELLSNLIVESIQIKGYNFYYLPRRHGNLNELLSQDDLSYFDTAYIVEMYIKSVEGFAGEGQYLSKFGLDIRDRMTFTVARATFNTIVGAYEGTLRPYEGDLIFFPMTNKIWEVKQADPWADFYPMGSLPMFDLICDVFEYDNEHFDTGIPAIDNIEQQYSTNVEEFYEKYSNGVIIVDGNNNPIIEPGWSPANQDPEFDNYDANTTVTPMINYTIKNPFSPTGNV